MSDYTVEIEPRPAQRPRYAKRGKNVKVYHAETYQAYLDELREYEFDEHFTENVIMSVTFYCKKAKTSKLLTPNGDIDNFLKGFLDGVQPNLILDDKQVTAIYAEKVFTPEEKGWIQFSIKKSS